MVLILRETMKLMKNNAMLHLTDEGYAKAEKMLGVNDLFEPEEIPGLTSIN